MIQDFLQSLWIWLVSLAERFIPNYILPNLQIIVQVVILLIVAYIVGKIVKAVTVKILSVVGFKRMTTRSWAESVLKVTGYRGSIVELIGDLVKWFVYIVFLGIIIQIIGLPGVADWFTQVAVFMPRFIGAIVIIVIGFIVADFFGKVFEEAGKKFLGEEVLSRLFGGLIKYSVALIAVIMGLSLVGLDTVSLTIMFTLILSTLIIIMIFGIKDIFPNFSASVHLRKTLKPGTHIKVGPYSGVVEKVEPVSVILRNGNKTIVIPNSMLLKNPIEKKSGK